MKKRFVSIRTIAEIAHNLIKYVIPLWPKPSKAQRALDDWYLAPKKDYTLFAEKYPMNGELKQQDASVEAMSGWCQAAEISYTPTIFVNGYRLPENYDIEQLQYIL